VQAKMNELYMSYRLQYNYSQGNQSITKYD